MTFLARRLPEWKEHWKGTSAYLTTSSLSPFHKDNIFQKWRILSFPDRGPLSYWFIGQNHFSPARMQSQKTLLLSLLKRVPQHRCTSSFPVLSEWCSDDSRSLHHCKILREVEGVKRKLPTTLKNTEKSPNLKWRLGGGGCPLPEEGMRVSILKSGLCSGKGGPHPERELCMWKGGGMLYLEEEPGFEEVFQLWRGVSGGSHECTGRGVPAIGGPEREGVPPLEGPAMKGAPGGKEGLAQRKAGHGGGALSPPESAEGRQPRREHVQWSRGHPEGQGGGQGLGCVRREQSSHPLQKRQDSPAVLTEAAGETVHLAGKAPGSGLSGAGTSFSGPTEWPTLSLTRSLSRSSGSAPGSCLRRPSVRPGVVSRGRRDHFPVRLRAAPLYRLPGLPPRQRAPRRAAPRPAPAPARSSSPAPRTPSHFRLRLPRDATEAGSCQPRRLTLPRPRRLSASRQAGGCACAVGLLKPGDHGLVPTGGDKA